MVYELAQPEAAALKGQTPAAWLAEQAAMALSEPVLKEAINKLSERGVRYFDGPAQMREALKETLSVTPGANNQITVDFRTQDKEFSLFLLEAMDKSIRPFHDRALGKVGAYKIVQVPLRDANPAEDDWLKLFATILGAALGGAVVLLIVLRVWLGRSSKVFDESADVLNNLGDTHWPHPEGKSAPAKLD
jgi:hypothetical protein